MSNGGWPSWLDQAEQLAKNDRTCPDCWRVVDGDVVFPVFKGDGCNHRETNRDPES